MLNLQIDGGCSGIGSCKSDTAQRVDLSQVGAMADTERGPGAGRPPAKFREETETSIRRETSALPAIMHDTSRCRPRASHAAAMEAAQLPALGLHLVELVVQCPALRSSADRPGNGSPMNLENIERVSVGIAASALAVVAGSGAR